MKRKPVKHWQISLILGVFILSAILFSVICASSISNYSPEEIDSSIRLEAPGPTHLFGTDAFGRDIFTRSLYGGQTTLVSTVSAMAVALTIGIIAGLVSGMYYNTIIDTLIMRLIDILMAFPFIILAMIVTALFGTGLTNLLFVVCAVWWVPFARLTRGITLKHKRDTAVEAAVILGANKLTIAFHELLPKALPPVIIQATFELGNLVLSISALSFLGLGAKPPTPEWGSMLSEGRAYFFDHPHVLFGPALFIILTVLALNLIGEGLRDWLDPYEIIKT